MKTVNDFLNENFKVGDKIVLNQKYLIKDKETKKYSERKGYVKKVTKDRILVVLGTKNKSVEITVSKEDIVSREEWENNISRRSRPFL